ncbi:hypothetical protein OIO90_006293 [Microbotryomycetes sp. JL221]|nr:hypothetical protein OIO90_006293 [Microbotryomycetes sp. JL221]
MSKMDNPTQQTKSNWKRGAKLKSKSRRPTKGTLRATQARGESTLEPGRPESAPSTSQLEMTSVAESFTTASEEGQKPEPETFSKPMLYVAPHRRALATLSSNRSDDSVTTRLVPTTQPCTPYTLFDHVDDLDQQAGLPEAEDHFYSCPVSDAHSPQRHHADSLPVSPEMSFDSSSISTPAHNTISAFPLPPSNFGHLSRNPSSDGNDGPESDQVEQYLSPLALSHRASLDSRRSSISSTTSADDDVDFLIRFGQRRGSLFAVAGIDVPSPVVEEGFHDQQTHALTQIEQGLHGQEEDCRCTGCGALPEASFVALLPCGHLVCPICITSIVNAVAHKPPRDPVCFECSEPIASFIPAWNGVGYDRDTTLLAALEDSFALLYNIDPGNDFPEQDSPSEQAIKRPIRRLSIARTDSAPYLNRTPSWTVSSLSEVLDDAESPLPKVQRRTSLPHAFTPWQAHQSSRDQNQAGTQDSAFSASTPNFALGSNAFSFGFDETGQASGYETPVTSMRKVVTDRVDPDAEESPLFRAKNESVPSQFEDTSSFEPISWPVVRIDNIPWDITVAEVEDWLPENCLPPVANCFMSVHILCNRTDGRTLNQCYVEVESMEAARTVVRLRDGQKMRSRWVHVTVSGPAELLSTLFPTYAPGFNGAVANFASKPCPLLLQTELNGLLSLCKLESSHAIKVMERPYFNIVSILHKFPWRQIETWNSQQVLRLFNASCAAVEILVLIRDRVDDWNYILDVFCAGVMACEGFRSTQKAKFWRKVEDLVNPAADSSALSLSPKTFRDNFVTCRPLTRASWQDSVESFNLDKQDSSASPSSVNSTPQSTRKTRHSSQHHRRLSSIARELNLDVETVQSVAQLLGVAAPH